MDLENQLLGFASKWLFPKFFLATIAWSQKVLLSFKLLGRLGRLGRLQKSTPAWFENDFVLFFGVQLKNRDKDCILIVYK